MVNTNMDCKVSTSKIAKELGVSKSTVSRALNGKGRISEKTRKMILDKARDYDYVPGQKKSLPESKNIAVVIPDDSEKCDIPFFQNCLVGISEAVYKSGYDVILVVQKKNDITPLVRIVQGKKADGVVLTRIVENDENVSYLKNVGIPFVVVGTSPDESVFQIDSDQTEGCAEMTKFMISRGVKKAAVLGGDEKHTVNRMRVNGFMKAFRDLHVDFSENIYCMNIMSLEDVERVLPVILKDNPECLVCLDDFVCVNVLKWLRSNDYEIPEDIQVVSFFDSSVLENSNPPVTALNVSIGLLSKKIGKLIVSIIEKKDVPVHTKVNYELNIRKSFR